MSSSEFHEKLKSKSLCDFRLGTVVTSDHETPLTAWKVPPPGELVWNFCDPHAASSRKSKNTSGCLESALESIGSVSGTSLASSLSGQCGSWVLLHLGGLGIWSASRPCDILTCHCCPFTKGCARSRCSFSWLAVLCRFLCGAPFSLTVSVARRWASSFRRCSIGN